MKRYNIKAKAIELQVKFRGHWMPFIFDWDSCFITQIALENVIYFEALTSIYRGIIIIKICILWLSSSKEPQKINKQLKVVVYVESNTKLRIQHIGWTI